MIINEIGYRKKSHEKLNLFFIGLMLSMSNSIISSHDSSENVLSSSEKKIEEKTEFEIETPSYLLDNLSNDNKTVRIEDFRSFCSELKKEIEDFDKFTEEAKKFLLDFTGLDELSFDHMILMYGVALNRSDICKAIHEKPNVLGINQNPFVYCFNENCKRAKTCLLRENPFLFLVDQEFYHANWYLNSKSSGNGDDRNVNLIVSGCITDSPSINLEVILILAAVHEINDFSPFGHNPRIDNSIVNTIEKLQDLKVNKRINLIKNRVYGPRNFTKWHGGPFQSQNNKPEPKKLINYLKFLHLHHDLLFKRNPNFPAIENVNSESDTKQNNNIKDDSVEKIISFIRKKMMRIFEEDDKYLQTVLIDSKPYYEEVKFVFKQYVRNLLNFLRINPTDTPVKFSQFQSVVEEKEDPSDYYKLEDDKFLINKVNLMLKHKKKIMCKQDIAILTAVKLILEKPHILLGTPNENEHIKEKKPKKNLARTHAKMLFDLKNSESRQKIDDEQNFTREKPKVDVNDSKRSADKNIQQKKNLPNNSFLRTVSHNDHESASTSIENSTVNATKSTDQIFDDDKLENSKTKETIRAESIVHQSFRNPAFDIDVKMSYPEIYTTSGISRKQFEEECFIKKEKIKTRKNIPGVSGLTEPVTNTINDNTKVGKKNVQIKSKHNLINSESEAQAELTQKKFKKNLNDTKKIKNPNCSPDKLSITESDKKNQSFSNNTETKSIDLTEEFLAIDQKKKKNKHYLNLKKKERSDAYFKKVLAEQVVYE